MRRHRTTLERQGPLGLPPIGWVMLNPSTADDSVDDPTIRRVCGFSAQSGFGDITVANLFTLRATRPPDLFAAIRVGRCVNGPGHRTALNRIACLQTVVVAWGRPANRAVHDRASAVLKHLRASPCRVLAIGEPLSGGHPRHPLYAPYLAGLRDFP